MSGNAKLVAEKLTAKFLELGSFTSAVPMSGRTIETILPSASSTSLDIEPVFEDAGFAGLAVQAVGYAEGGPDSKVHVYVSKGSRKAIDGVETSEGEVRIEVNRVGRLVVRPELANTATNRGHVFLRGQRVACGSSCAPSTENYSGTFGAVVRKQTGSQLYILSNNHVLAACNHTPVGMPILSPSSMDASPNVRAPGEIARHAEICELRSGVPALVNPCREDLALARVAAPDAVSSWQGDAENGYDTPRNVAPLVSGMRVKKFGRTTGLTTGTVEAALTLATIPYKSRYFSATVYFDAVWTVLGDAGTTFALPGDSGSLVVTEDETASVGLVFAWSASGGYGIIIPMAHIVTCFGGLRLVQGHGVAP